MLCLQPEEPLGALAPPFFPPSAAGGPAVRVKRLGLRWTRCGDSAASAASAPASGAASSSASPPPPPVHSALRFPPGVTPQLLCSLSSLEGVTRLSRLGFQLERRGSSPVSLAVELRPSLQYLELVALLAEGAEAAHQRLSEVVRAVETALWWVLSFPLVGGAGSSPSAVSAGPAAASRSLQTGGRVDEEDRKFAVDSLDARLLRPAAEVGVRRLSSDSESASRLRLVSEFESAGSPLAGGAAGTADLSFLSSFRRHALCPQWLGLDPSPCRWPLAPSSAASSSAAESAASTDMLCCAAVHWVSPLEVAVSCPSCPPIAEQARDVCEWWVEELAGCLLAGSELHRRVLTACIGLKGVPLEARLFLCLSEWVLAEVCVLAGRRAELVRAVRRVQGV